MALKNNKTQMKIIEEPINCQFGAGNMKELIHYKYVAPNIEELIHCQYVTFKYCRVYTIQICDTKY